MHEKDDLSEKESWAIYNAIFDYVGVFMEDNKYEIYADPTPENIAVIFTEKGLSYFPDNKEDYFFPVVQLYGTMPEDVLKCLSIMDIDGNPTIGFTDHLIGRVRETSGTPQ